MKSAALKLESWDIDKVQPYELNAKKHPEDQIARLVKSIQDFGWDQPIVVDGDGVIIKGHGRRLAALKLGLKKVPVLVRADLTPEQVRAARLADNRVAMSDIDTDMLRQELQELNYDLSGIFDSKELDFVVADLGEINTDVFVDDVSAAVEEQHAETEAKIAGAGGKLIPLHKAFGFKQVEAAGQIHITRFMAKAEAETGLQGERALIAYLQRLAA